MLLVAAIYMLIIEIPVVAHAIWPEQTLRVVTAVNGWLSRHGRTIVMIAAGAAGIYLVVTSVMHIANPPAPPPPA